MSQEADEDFTTFNLPIKAFADPAEGLPYGSSSLVALQEGITNLLERLAPSDQIEIRYGFGWLVHGPVVMGVRIGGIHAPPPGCPLQIQIAVGVVVDVPLSLALYREIALAGCHNYAGRFFLQEGTAPKDGFGLVAIREALPGSLILASGPTGVEAFGCTFEQIGALAASATPQFIERCGGRPLTQDEEFSALLMA